MTPVPVSRIAGSTVPSPSARRKSSDAFGKLPFHLRNSKQTYVGTEKEINATPYLRYFFNCYETSCDLIKGWTYLNPVACKGEASRPLICLFNCFFFLILLFWNETSAGLLNSLMTPLLYGRLSQTGSSDRALTQGLRLRLSVLLTGLSVVEFCMLASLSAPAVLGVSFIQLDIRRITWPNVKLNLRLHRIRFTCWLACSQMTRTVDTSLSTDKKMWFGVSC